MVVFFVVVAVSIIELEALIVLVGLTLVGPNFCIRWTKGAQLSRLAFLVLKL